MAEWSKALAWKVSRGSNAPRGFESLPLRQPCDPDRSQAFDIERDQGLTTDQSARQGIAALRAVRKAITGFGHPEHSAGDPRANRLLALASEHCVEGRHIELVRAVARQIPETIGRKLPINVNGAIPAVMLDAGYPLSALKGISLLARTASLIAHLQEETERPIGFIMAGAAADHIDFAQR